MDFAKGEILEVCRRLIAYDARAEGLANRARGILGEGFSESRTRRACRRGEDRGNEEERNRGEAGREKE